MYINYVNNDFRYTWCTGYKYLSGNMATNKHIPISVLFQIVLNDKLWWQHKYIVGLFSLGNTVWCPVWPCSPVSSLIIYGGKINLLYVYIQQAILFDVLWAMHNELTGLHGHTEGTSNCTSIPWGISLQLIVWLQCIVSALGVREQTGSLQQWYTFIPAWCYCTYTRYQTPDTRYKYRLWDP